MFTIILVKFSHFFRFVVLLSLPTSWYSSFIKASYSPWGHISTAGIKLNKQQQNTPIDYNID